MAAPVMILKSYLCVYRVPKYRNISNMTSDNDSYRRLHKKPCRLIIMAVILVSGNRKFSLVTWREWHILLSGSINAWQEFDMHLHWLYRTCSLSFLHVSTIVYPCTKCIFCIKSELSRKACFLFSYSLVRLARWRLVTSPKQIVKYPNTPFLFFMSNKQFYLIYVGWPSSVVY